MIANYYSPAQPAGDTALLSPGLQMVLTGAGGAFYKVAGSGALTFQTGNPGMYVSFPA